MYFEVETTSLPFSFVLNLVFEETHLTVPRGPVGREQNDTSTEMDEWIIVACSALRFFKFMQSISKKKHQTVSWACRNDKARIQK